MGCGAGEEQGRLGLSVRERKKRGTAAYGYTTQARVRQFRTHPRHVLLFFLCDKKLRNASASFGTQPRLSVLFSSRLLVFGVAGATDL